jgi:predicted aspartyl protease
MAAIEPILNSIQETQKMLTTLFLSQEARTLPISKYDPRMNISTWIDRLEIQATNVGLDDKAKAKNIGHYLPDYINQWLTKAVPDQVWTTIVTYLKDTYGTNDKKEVELWKKELKALKQDTIAIREYRVAFESVLQQFPSNHPLDELEALNIFVNNLRPRLIQLIEPNLYQIKTWKEAFSRAQFFEDRQSNHFEQPQPLHQSAQTYQATPQSAYQPSSTYQTPPQQYDNTDVAPMEIDALRTSFTRKKSSYGRHNSSDQRNNDSQNMRRWTSDGVPICGHCGKTGHLTKRCYQRRKTPRIQSITQEQDTDLNPPSMENPETICLLSYLTNPDIVYTGPKARCFVNDIEVQCLIDTGATISAVKTASAKKLGLIIDSSRVTPFTTANGQTSQTQGLSSVSLTISGTLINTTCHVIDQLPHPIILGYPDLQRMRAVIDTTDDTICFPPLSQRHNLKQHFTTTTQAHKVAPQSHMYISIQGPANIIAFVSTPAEMIAQKLFAIAAGIVQFDQQGITNVNLANFRQDVLHISPGQRIASIELLPRDPLLTTLTTNSPDHIQSIESANIDPNLSATSKGQLLQLLKTFQDCFSAKSVTTTHYVKHHIPTHGHPPIHSAPHRTSATETENINNLINEMLQQGVIRESHSPWSSPVVLVKKKDGTPRFCVDYRKLNAITSRDVYPLPRIDDTLYSLGSAKIFSTLDLTSSYWQIQLDDRSKPKSAFITRRGLFEFIRMPFGLSNTPATMQRLMDSVLSGLKWQVCLVYLDTL